MMIPFGITHRSAFDNGRFVVRANYLAAISLNPETGSNGTVRKVPHGVGSSFVDSGGAEGARTPNQPINNRLLCLLELPPLTCRQRPGLQPLGADIIRPRFSAAAHL